MKVAINERHQVLGRDSKSAVFAGFPQTWTHSCCGLGCEILLGWRSWEQTEFGRLDLWALSTSMPLSLEQAPGAALLPMNLELIRK